MSVVKTKAFPSHYAEETKSMDLRDYFAAAALSAMIKNQHSGHGGSQSGDTHYDYAVNAYKFADMMMTIRSQ